MGTPLDRGFPAGAGRLMRTPYFVVDEKSLLRKKRKRTLSVEVCFYTDDKDNKQIGICGEIS